MGIIDLARELTQNFLNGKTKKLGKAHFYMFSISKFILLKEKILKKDSINKILYFDNVKNRKYIPIIYKIYDYIKENGTFFVKQSDRVFLSAYNENSQKLKESLWILNKIRDSFAHGRYFFDLKGEKIVIDNDHMNENEPYSLKCAIPLSLLNSFSFFINDINDKNQLKDVFEKFNIDAEKQLNDMLYWIDFDTKKKYQHNKELNNKINLYNERLDNKINLYNERLDNKINLSNDMLELDKLIAFVINYLPKNETEKKVIYKILLKYKELKEAKEKAKQEDLDKIDIDTRLLIKEIHSILGIEDKNQNYDELVSLYNYMSLSFSLVSNIDYSHIRTRNLQFKFDKNYYDIVSGIISLCNNFNDNIEILIKQYEEHPNKAFRHSLLDKFTEFYDNVMKKYGIKNKMLITSIRNSVEHGNYMVINKKCVGLYDQPNQNDNSTIKFSCISDSETLFELTNEINKKDLEDEYIIEDFFEELKSIIDTDLYNRTLVNLNRLSIIIFGRELDMANTIKSMYMAAVAIIIDTNAKLRR